MSEARPAERRDLPLFHRRARPSDDSVLTVAGAHALVADRACRDSVRAHGRRDPDAGYGAAFIGWLARADPRPYNRFGNGAET